MNNRWRLYLPLACAAIMVMTTGVCGDDAAKEPASPTSTHQQTKIISIPMGDQKVQIHTFCVDSKGRLLCSCGGEQVVMKNIEGGFKSEIVKNEPGIRVVSPEGKLLDVWEVDFTPQTVNVGPDGFVYCGGAGKIAKLTADGKIVKVIDSPNVKEMKPLPEIPEEIKMTDAEKEERAKQKEHLSKQVAELRKEMSDLRAELTPESLGEAQETYMELFRKSREKDLDEEEAKKLEAEVVKARLALSKAYTESYKKRDESEEYQTLNEKYREVAMKLHELSMNPLQSAIYQRNAAMRSRRISGIAVNDNDVFICCQPPTGYGFQVWRGDLNLENFKMIVPSLRGCCGNMDIQAHGDRLYAAENSRKKVVVFDRDGEKQVMWGDSGRDGTGLNFGSCCNPMNIRFDQDGNVLTSESNVGIIKRFTPEGEFLGRVGKVKIIPGCKHVAIGVADQGKKVYMLDITRSHIVLMEPVTEE